MVLSELRGVRWFPTGESSSSSVVLVVISPSVSPSVSKATKIDVEKILDFFLHFVKSFGGVKISHFYH